MGPRFDDEKYRKYRRQRRKYQLIFFAVLVALLLLMGAFGGRTAEEGALSQKTVGEVQELMVI